MEDDRVQDLWCLLDYYFEPDLPHTDEEVNAKFPVLRKYNLDGNNHSELLELIGFMSKGTVLEKYAGWMVSAAFGYSDQTCGCYDTLKTYYDNQRGPRPNPR